MSDRFDEQAMPEPSQWARHNAWCLRDEGWSVKAVAYALDAAHAAGFREARERADGIARKRAAHKSERIASGQFSEDICSVWRSQQDTAELIADEIRALTPDAEETIQEPCGTCLGKKLLCKWRGAYCDDLDCSHDHYTCPDCACPERTS